MSRGWDERQWEALAAEAFLGMKDWRLQHPKATFRVIEQALDARLSTLRTRMLQDVALASAATDVRAQPAEERAPCPTCGGTMGTRGQDTRSVTTTHGQTVTLTRSYTVCAACGAGVFPLDEELQLWPGECSPTLAEGAVHLGTWVPFERLPDLLRQFTGTLLSASTIQRVTEAAGAAAVALQDEAVARLARDLPAPPPGPAVLQVSVDGAMIPLRGKGEWAEAKTLAVAEVQPAVVHGQGEREVPVTARSYFSRLADAETFGRLATVETHRRGVETAGTVCGVVDGAEWCQGFLDLHRPDAIRILDFPHAAGYLAQVAQAGLGAGTAAATAWLTTQCHTLKHDSPSVVLAAVRTVRATVAARGDATGLAVVATSLAYLEKREAQLAYATFVAQGYPIGSGLVESANKLVVEARLKGAGMHWARAHVNPLLALRTIVCSDRWDETWPTLVHHVRAQQRATAAQRRATRVTRRAVLLDPVAGGSVERVAASGGTTVHTPLPTDPVATGPATAGPATAGPAPMPSSPQASRAPRRPATTHPWRRRFILPKRDEAA